MRVLNLSLDKTIFDENSKFSQRVREYENLVDKYTAVAPDSKNKTIGLFKLFIRSKKILGKEKYDVISVQDPYYLGLAGLILSKMFKVGLEIQIHGFEKYSGLRRLVAKFVIPRADSIRVVSQRMKRQMIEEFGVEENKVTVVPIYTEVESRKLKVERKDGKFVFLTVGRLVPVKNISLQLEALRELKVKSEKLKVELWIVGEGPERKNLEFRIKNLELQNHVKMLGWQRELKGFYDSADAFLLTSDYEGWGMAAIEAAASGLPIIMTDVGCAGEFIKNNESGVIIPIGDKEKLSSAMTSIIEDRGLRERLGASAKIAVSSLPSKQKTMDLYLETWKKAISNKKHE